MSLLSPGCRSLIAAAHTSGQPSKGRVPKWPPLKASSPSEKDAANVAKSSPAFNCSKIDSALACISRSWPKELLSGTDRKSTRLNSSHVAISYAVFCLKKKMTITAHKDIQKAQ